MHLPIFFRVASLALGQSHDCPNASEVTLKNISKSDSFQNYKTQQNVNHMHDPQEVQYLTLRGELWDVYYEYFREP